MERYEGPLTEGMILTCPDNDGVLGLRRVKLLHQEGDRWIYEEAASRMTKPGGRVIGELGRTPEVNLRIVFRPEVIVDHDPGDESDHLRMTP